MNMINKLIIKREYVCFAVRKARSKKSNKQFYRFVTAKIRIIFVYSVFVTGQIRW